MLKRPEHSDGFQGRVLFFGFWVFFPFTDGFFKLTFIH